MRSPTPQPDEDDMEMEREKLNTIEVLSYQHYTLTLWSCLGDGPALKTTG